VLEHSVMARQWFKSAWTKIIPEPAERSTYVLLSSLLLILLFWPWRPMTGIIWDVEHPAGQFILWSLFALGWLLVLTSTF
jgi:protein-S-isoprenylcysteine O-methyltransferase Ste14